MAAKRELLPSLGRPQHSVHVKAGLLRTAKRNDLPGVLALSVLAVLEVVSAQFFAASDQINRYGPVALTDGHYQFQPDIGIAGLSLPFVIAAWLLGKRRPIRVLFRIAIGSSLIGLVVLVIEVLGTINTRSGNFGAATLLVDAGLLWVMNVTIFALWYWSTDSGGPVFRGTPSETRPDFEFAQQRRHIKGWQHWVPAFHDYLHAAFATSLTFHPAGVEVLSGRAKYVTMVQAAVSVSILLLLVAKAIATFTPAP
jgi:hypothetical protein